MSIHSLVPRYPVPSLNVPVTGGGRFVLGANPGEHFDLIVFAGYPYKCGDLATPRI